MLQKNIIDINNIDKYDLLYCKIPEPTEDNFTMLYDKEIFKLIEISKKHNVDIFTLTNLVLYIYSFINNNEVDQYYKLAYPSYEKIADDLGIGETTISKYTDILKSEQMIECDFAGYKVTSNGKIKNSKQYYCRHQDKNNLKEVIEYERQYDGFLKLNNRNKNKSNTKRSIKQIINNIEKKKLVNMTSELEEERCKLLKKEYEKLD